MEAHLDSGFKKGFQKELKDTNATLCTSLINLGCSLQVNNGLLIWEIFIFDVFSFFFHF